MNRYFSLNLNFFGFVIFLTILIFGFRSDIFLNTSNFPPHYFQFNMYKFEISSTVDKEIKAADFYIPKTSKTYTSPELRKIKQTKGHLIQGDRSSGYSPVINAYFCEIKDNLLLKNEKSFKIISLHLVNNKKLVSNEYYIMCND